MVVISNGKIIGENCDSSAYRTQTVKRGDPAYVMSRGSLFDFARNPIKWLRGKEEDEGTTATDWGSLLDCMVLDRPNFNKRYVTTPATYPAGPRHAKVRAGEISVGDPLPWNSNAAYCDEWISANLQGREVADADDVDGCKLAIYNLLRDEDIANILEHSKFQVMLTAEWRDPDTGMVIPLKALVDIVPNEDCPALEAPESLIDLKSTKNAEEESWVRDVAKYGLDVQAALYLEIWNSIPGVKPRTFFKHLISENEHPYYVEKQSLTKEFLDRGKSIYQYALRTYCQCLKTGEWPGYKKRIVVNGWGQTQPTVWQLTNVE